MPIYEYECEACGHHYDILQKASDPLLTICPECSQPSLKKLISAAGFRLSGSGWYETDFKSDNKTQSGIGGFTEGQRWQGQPAQREGRHERAIESWQYSARYPAEYRGILKRFPVVIRFQRLARSARSSPVLARPGTCNVVPVDRYHSSIVRHS